MTTLKGLKYDANRDISQTAKMIKKDILDMYGSGFFTKLSVKVQKYSGGRSILISARINNCINDENIKYIKADIQGILDDYNCRIYPDNPFEDYMVYLYFGDSIEIFVGDIKPKGLNSLK